MRLLLLFLGFNLLLSHSLLGQKKTITKPPTIQPNEDDEERLNCAKKTTLSFSSRIKKYPFSKVSEVRFVSFKEEKNAYGEIEPESYHIPKQNDTICYSKMYEIQSLTLIEIDKLTDILFNYGYKAPPTFDVVASCYIPRNAILFIDAAGRVFDYIEICFQCERLKYGTKHFPQIDMCSQKAEMLRKLFANKGIKYGVTEGVVD